MKMTRTKTLDTVYGNLYSTIAIGTLVLLIAAGALAAFGPHRSKYLGFELSEWPLLIALLAGGIPLATEILAKLLRLEFGSDILAATSILVSIILGEYVAGAIVVLMLSGGQTLEQFAVRRASSVLAALANRMPNRAHRKTNDGQQSIPLTEINLGDRIVVYPHEICPVDGVVLQGHGGMDESYLTGEPFQIAKSVGSHVFSGAINGNAVLEIEAIRRAEDSRYSKIMQVMQDSVQRRPRIRRLGDQLGAWYTPIALAMASVSWLASGDPVRFLAVLVVATPCPLLIAIPVAVIGSVSLAARRSIIVKDPAILERLSSVKTAMFDKTGTLTYGRPILVEIVAEDESSKDLALQLAASLERYSKHPLGSAIIDAARNKDLRLLNAEEVHEEPGSGLRGMVEGQRVIVGGRKQLEQIDPSSLGHLPSRTSGLECVVIIDNCFKALLRFLDQPREDGHRFVDHLGPLHNIHRVILISGDRQEEVSRLAEQLGIDEVYAGQSPEQKLEIVRREARHGNVVFMGDGINDAPALAAATIGIAFGQASEITSEAADAVVLDSSLERVDELLHIGRRMRTIALQSALGGMTLSVVGMIVAAFGYLPPVAGAILQEGIDIFAVVNALRTAYPPRELSDL